MDPPNEPSPRNLYDVLGIEQGAPGYVVERAYWQFVDSWRSAPPQQGTRAVTIEDANYAYEVLVSREARAEYDARLVDGVDEAFVHEEEVAAPLRALERLRPQMHETVIEGPPRGARRIGHGLRRLPGSASARFALFIALALTSGFLFAARTSYISASRETVLFVTWTAALLGLMALVHGLDRRRDAKSIARVSENLAALIAHSNDPIWLLDRDGMFTSVNTCGEDLLGYGADSLTNMKAVEVVAGEYIETVEELRRGARPGLGAARARIELLTRSGQRVPVELATVPTNGEGAPADVLWIARDERAQKRMQQELSHLASHDSLTGLFNRRRFEEELNLEVGRCRRHGRPSAVLFVDLDHFKDVNDVLGHAAGDELLVRLSELLKTQLRDTDILGRLGGDEFTIILPETDLPGAREIAERLIAAVGSHEVKLQGQSIPMTASIGIARIPDDGRGTQELLASADMAMYQAKETGRNRVCDYGTETGLQGLIEKRLEWRRRIADAISHDLLMLYGQPILDLKRGGISQYELLIRMRSADGGVYEATKFMDTAERFGMMRPIDRWVVAEGIRIAALHGRRNPGLAFEINISGHAFSDEKLLDIIADGLTSSGADPKNIVFEVTETAAIRNIDAANRFVAQLTGMGCRFALDDFGVGFSSLHQLKTLDVDFLKIDGAFIRNLASEVVDQHLVKAIVEVARALGKATIAEFVGDGKALGLLREYGVDFAQGFYVGTPEEMRPPADTGASKAA